MNTTIYIHWPFCKSKCPYCDFNSHVALDNTIFHDYIEGYVKELDYYKEYLKNKKVTSIYFGGGTPSLAPIAFFHAIIAKIGQLATIDQDTEITAEANPTSIEIQKFKDLKLAGINRISVGIQSLIPKYLTFLGREHSAKDGIHALNIVGDIFTNYSFDLIYALPQQSLQDWSVELEYALSYASNHISLYQLTIERGTQFYIDYKKGKFEMPQEDLAADFYLLTQKILEQHTMPAYEVSNHAKLGFYSKHNTNYWDYGDYLGIGAGAHGRYTLNKQKYATMNYHMPSKWLTATSTKNNGLQKHYQISEKTQYEERIIMGLRSKINRKYIKNKQQLELLLANQLLMQDKNDYIYATTQGKLLLNQVIFNILK